MPTKLAEPLAHRGLGDVREPLLQGGVAGTHVDEFRAVPLQLGGEVDQARDAYERVLRRFVRPTGREA